MGRALKRLVINGMNWAPFSYLEVQDTGCNWLYAGL